MTSTVSPSVFAGDLVLEARGLDLVTPTGRSLLRDLDLRLEREHVALVGRNGVGKSSLLAVLAGEEAPHRGVVRRHADIWLVHQELAGDTAASRGEARRAALLEARARHPGLLLLDEPTEGLDVDAVDELCGWLVDYPGAVLVASHQRQLLGCFRHFFVLEDRGARYFAGSFADLLEDLERRRERDDASYARTLGALTREQRHDARVRRRRRRKKNLGRIHEEGRAPSRAQLHGKKGYAQKSQARVAKIREQRLAATQTWARLERRALEVRLPLRLQMPELPRLDGGAGLELRDVGHEVGGRRLFGGLDLRLARDRLALLGPNGAGKSTLLGILREEVSPIEGEVKRRGLRVVGIAQGAEDWRRPESLLEMLTEGAPDAEVEALMALVASHGFPLGLALRPLSSLSAGERTRAALIGVMQGAPDLILLDEPTASLDLHGATALGAALASWPGGLVVASHDRGFLRDAGIDRALALGRGEHVVVAPLRPESVVARRSPWLDP
ncbi:MAG: ATP-binding cassette domain-containing protein [Polyangiaceae bacterium]